MASNNYIVKDTALRYVVPFTYEGEFDLACEKIEKQKYSTYENKKAVEKSVWDRNVASAKNLEQDLYEYIKNEFLFDSNEEPLKPTKSGASWKYQKYITNSKKDKAILKLRYYTDVIKKDVIELPEYWDVTLSDAGLYLFRNNIGFIWYELSLPSDKTITSTDIKDFQYEIRELNRGTKLWNQTEDKECIEPFVLGMWVMSTLDLLKPSYFAQRKAHFKNLIKENLKLVAKVENASVNTEERNLPDWDYAPDKALLFGFYNFSKDTMTKLKKSHMEELAYHLANGYKDSYQYSGNDGTNMKRPNANVIWNATQEGVSYLCFTDESNKSAFGNIKTKYKTDYFSLYIKTLYQSYSLLQFAERIQNEIRIDNENHYIENADDKIYQLYGAINLFLTKNMATSVSHIHNQSEFYIYLKERLRIHEDVKSITAGLNAMDALQRERRKVQDRENERELIAKESEREEEQKRRDANIQAGVGLFAVLGIGSAALDMYEYVGKFWVYDTNNWGDVFLHPGLAFMEVILNGLVLIVGGYAACYAFRAWVEAKKENKKKSQKDEKDNGLV